MTEVKLGGTVALCCIHGREKSLVKELSVTQRFVSRCVCCDNMFASDSSEPQMCTFCSPKIIGGENKIG